MTKLLTTPTIKLAGVDIKVELHPPAAFDEAYGDADMYNKLIRVSDALTPDMRGFVLLHEILHIYDDMLGIGLKHSQNNPIAHLIIDLIRNNPQVVRAILEWRK